MPSPKITERPLVSIGMCVFNCDRFLPQSIESLLAQDYENFELIISDNASEDRTGEICLEYQARDPRIQYSRNETNMGAIFNGSKVKGLARGKYFMWVSDHDLWHPTLVTKCVEVLENDPAVILCYSRAQRIDVNGAFLFLAPMSLDTRGMSPAARYAHIINNIVGGEAIYGLYRLEAVKHKHGKAVWASDLAFLTDLSLYGAFAHLPEVLFSLRMIRDETMEGNKKNQASHLDPAKTQEMLALSMPENWRQNGEACIAAVQASSLPDLEKEVLISETRKCYTRRYGVQWPAGPGDGSVKEDIGQAEAQTSKAAVSGKERLAERRAARLARKAAENKILADAAPGGDISAKEWPLVSVVVPTYNRPDALVAALQSILSQTYEHHEIIVVNDCGVDVGDLVNWLNQRGNITYVRHDRNRERAAARNTALKLARGKYIAYLDDDDLFYPDHLETLVAFLENSDYRAAYTDARRAHQEKQYGRYVTTSRDLPYSNDFRQDNLFVTNQFPNLCLMHEQSCLEKTGLFDETLVTHEDWDLWIRLSCHFKFFHIKKVTCEFSWRQDGSTTTSQKAADFLRTLELIHARYDRYHQDQPQIKERQRHFFQNHKKAQEALIAAAAHGESGPEGLLQRVNAALDREDWPTAEKCLRDLIRFYPDLIDSYLSLSDVLTLQGKHREAGEVLRAARQVDPEALPLLKRLGLNCRQQGDLSGAMAALKKVWTHSPTDPEVLAPLAVTCLDLGLFPEARGYFEEATKRNPRNIDLWLGVAKAAAQLGDRDTLEQAIGRVRALDSNHPQLLELTSSPTREAQEDAPPPAEVPDAPQSLAVSGLSSIIIPVFNNLSLTSQCLKSIRENTDAPHEIMVVNNGSSDGTGDYLLRMEAADSIRVITNRTNLGFARASNQGAQAARGEYLVFLNNDTIVKPGWLEELADCARKDEKIGVVGAKLLYPDDTIQHAGVVFSDDQLVHHIYQHFDPDHPAVNKEREFQAVTAACMLVKKDLFFEADGFDEIFRNGLEDVDLCFKLRQQGYKVIYNPRAAVYHLESKTPGRNDWDRQNSQILRSRWSGKIICDFQKTYEEDGITVEVLSREGNVASILAFDNNDNPFWRDAVRYRQEGRLDQAEACYQRAIRFNPFDPRKSDIAWELADLYETQGKHAQAEELRQEAAPLANYLSIRRGAGGSSESADAVVENG